MTAAYSPIGAVANGLRAHPIVLAKDVADDLQHFGDIERRGSGRSCGAAAVRQQPSAESE